MGLVSQHMDNLWQWKARSMPGMLVMDHANRSACAEINCCKLFLSSIKSWLPNLVTCFNVELKSKYFLNWFNPVVVIVSRV